MGEWGDGLLSKSKLSKHEDQSFNPELPPREPAWHLCMAETLAVGVEETGRLLGLLVHSPAPGSTRDPVSRG